jgi:hypothetical protein
MVYMEKTGGKRWRTKDTQLEVWKPFCRRLNIVYNMNLKVHKIENFFVSDFGICVISLLAMYK